MSESTLAESSLREPIVEISHLTKRFVLNSRQYGFRNILLHLPQYIHDRRNRNIFTALNDGLTSAVISFVRTLIFESVGVLLLPLLLGVDGIWVSTVAAEFAALLLGATFLIIKRKKYGY